jgi:hypothetical protein
MASRLLSLALLVVLAVAGFSAFHLLEATLAAEVYQERLAQLSSDHEALRELFNEAVRRTAVTELRVEEGSLSVVIRTADGELRVLPSSFDPSKEIYVDYVVVGGRLWIRRIFDEDTAPGEGMLVDPKLADVDWSADETSYGKAAYRSLDEGRWVVDVTGDGSLGLTRREEGSSQVLSPAPPVRDYEPVDTAVRHALGVIGPAEAARVVARRLGSWVRSGASS